MAESETAMPPLSDAYVEACYQIVFAKETAPYGGYEAVEAFIRELIDQATPEEREIIFKSILPVLNASRDPDVINNIIKKLGAIGARRLLERHDQRLMDTTFAPFIEAVRGADKCVVFVAHTPLFVILREAMYLKRNGYSVYLASVWAVPEFIQEVFDNHFDGVVYTFGSFRIMRRMLAALEPDIFHVQCWMWFYFLGRMAIEAKGQAMVVCEFFDITSLYAEREVLCRHWKPASVDFDFAMERFILHHADAVVHRFPADVIGEWKDFHGARIADLEMHPFACPEFVSYKDDKPPRRGNEIRLVYAGTVVPENKSYPIELFPEARRLQAIRSMLEQGMEVYVFPTPYSPVNETDEEYAAYFEMLKRNPGLHFLDSVPPDKLAETISVYDYGILLSDIDLDLIKVKDALMRGAVGTKLFAYLEAGLPVLVNAEYREMARIVTEHGVGMAVKSWKSR
ncbi:MAG TPA: hypothetical protein ENI79_04785, partial [Rhodospirillales bacterium]|nr:hypothetical protein [Rhodospirillales bacterium]